MEKIRTEKLNGSLQNERNKLLENSREEARKIVLKAKADSADLISRIKALLNQDIISDKDLFEARSVAKQLNNIEISNNDLEKDEIIFTGDKIDFTKLKVGDIAYSQQLGVQVRICEIRSKSRIKVKCGSFATEVNADDLYYSVKESNNKKSRFSQIRTSPKTEINTRSFNNELNVIGQTVDEAIVNVDAFIDSAVLAGVSQLWIIHGMGTGKLRAGLHSHFNNHPNVAEYRLGVYGEGESGVTVITLK